MPGIFCPGLSFRWPRSCLLLLYLHPLRFPVIADFYSYRDWNSVSHGLMKAPTPLRRGNEEKRKDSKMVLFGSVKKDAAQPYA